MSRHKHAQISSYYGAGPGVVAPYVGKVVRTEKVQSFTMTETGNDEVVAAIRRELGPQWQIRSLSEYVTGLHRDAGEFRGKGRLRRMTYVYRGSGAWRDLYVSRQRAWLYGPKRPATFDAAHTSSGVDAGGKFRAERSQRGQVSVQKKGMPRWGRWLRVWGWVVRLGGYDGNKDYRHGGWRDWDRKALGFPGMWDNRRPRHGSHGRPGWRRLIDACIARGRGVRFVDAWLSKTPPPREIDHWAVVSEVEIRDRKKRTYKTETIRRNR